MDRTTCRTGACYGFAVVTVALTVPIKLFVIDRLLGVVPPYMLFLFPVILTAWRAGVGPGLLAVVLNTLACAYFYHEPPWTLRIEDPREALMLSAFVAEGLLVCWLMGHLHRDRERAEEARRAQETFLAMVGHELRVQLNPVLIEASARLDDPTTPAFLRPSFDRIRRGAELQGRLIDDLLDAVRLGRNRASYRFKLTDTHEVVRQALEACRAEWEARRQRVSVDLEATGHFVRGDGERLQQVVWNLVRNASKFSPEGGVIEVRSRDEPCGTLVIEVADRGVGLDPVDRDAIFAPFAQAVATAGRFGGLGLGLAISRSIVEAHGGRLDVSSPGRGRGTTFSLRLSTLDAPSPEVGAGAGAGRECVPIDRSTEIAPDPEAGREPRRLVLVVDDDETTAQLLSELLGHDGYEVMVAHSVAGAMATPIDRVDCVITDLDRPDGSGVDLLRRIREHGETPIVVLSGYDSVTFALDERDDAEFAARLVKPVDYPALQSTLREAIERATPAVR
jgi:signal transduction histidine kinase/CheY-like chemotaxis protein